LSPPGHWKDDESMKKNDKDREASSRASIPVIVDVPRADPGLGFERYVSAIAAAIVGGEPAQYTVGLYGPWGTGKSSILLALEQELKTNHQQGVTAVTFDAWRHERAPNLLAPLMWTIKAALDQQSSAKEVWKKIFGGLEFQAFGFGFRMPSEADRSSQSMGAVNDYMLAMSSLTTIGEHLGDGRRVVVLVDDLDRCSPDRVIEVIEAIRLLMDVPGFVFVLAIDYDVLIDAVESRYPHADAHRFIEKIIQVPFRIPNIDPDADNYLLHVVPNWDELRDVWFKGLDDADIRSAIRLALRDNPRQIKRLLNSYMVASHIDQAGVAESDVKAKALLAALAMQLRWPDEFDELASDISRYRRGPGADVPNPVLSAVDAYQAWTRPDDVDISDDRQDLREFLTQHLDGGSPLRLVVDAMRLASDISGGDTGAAQSGGDRRLVFVDKVLGLLADRSDGFNYERGPTSASMRYQGKELASVFNPRSVPRTFEVRVRQVPAGFNWTTTAKQVDEGEWVRFEFGVAPGRSLDDVLEDAAGLINKRKSEVNE
jgi:hypothetical protein